MKKKLHPLILTEEIDTFLKLEFLEYFARCGYGSYPALLSSL